MIRRGFTGTALFSLASSTWANKPIDSIILSMLRLDRIIIRIFFGCVLGISLDEVKLCLALAAADQVVHHPDGFGIKFIVLLLADDALDLLALDVDLAGRVKALEASTFVDELRVDVLVDASEAEGVPAAEKCD